MSTLLVLLVIIALFTLSRAQNLIQNGDFDASSSTAVFWISPPGGATLGFQAGISGNAAILNCQDSNTCRFYQPVSTDRATTYTLSFYLNTGDATGYFGVAFGLNSQNDALPTNAIPGFVTIYPSNISSGWTMFSVNAPGDGPNDRVLFAAAGEWAVDNVSLVAMSSLSPDASSTSNSPSQSQSTTNNQNSDLSGGAIAGISVGVTVFVAVCGLLAAMLKFGAALVPVCCKRSKTST